VYAKKKYIIFALLSFIFILPHIARAESITNNNGIVISEEEYNDFLQVYDHNYIMHMSETKYNKLKTLDFDNLTKETKYIETVFNPSLQLTTEREITKEEYDNFNPVMPLLDDAGVSTETNAKILDMTIIGGTTWNWVTTGVSWKYIPVARSYDVVGFYGVGFDFGEGTQSGEQIYTLDGNYTTIDYAWNGTNIKKFSNGFGISMNIVNSDITTLQLLVECDVSPNMTSPSIYTSYQHAISDVTLAQSQNYTLGSTGLGGVFVFPYSISQKYDGMSGVHVDY